MTLAKVFVFRNQLPTCTSIQTSLRFCPWFSLYPNHPPRGSCRKAGDSGEEMVAAVWPTHVAKPFHCDATTPATVTMRVREHSHTPIYPSNPSDPSDSDTDNEDATAEGLNASP